jgi:hypothetical protein
VYPIDILNAAQALIYKIASFSESAASAITSFAAAAPANVSHAINGTAAGQLTIDMVTVLTAVLPALYASWQIMFRDVAISRTFVRSKSVQNWMLSFCALEILFHFVRIPVYLKFVIYLLVLPLVALPFLLELLARWAR